MSNILSPKTLKDIVEDIERLGKRRKIQRAGKRGVVVIISKKDWQALLKNGDSVGMIQVFSENELHEKFGDNPEEFIVRVKITPVAD